MAATAEQVGDIGREWVRVNFEHPRKVANLHRGHIEAAAQAAYDTLEGQVTALKNALPAEFNAGTNNAEAASMYEIALKHLVKALT